MKAEPLSMRSRRFHPLRPAMFAIVAVVVFVVVGVGPSLVPGFGRSDCGPRSALEMIRDLRGFWFVGERARTDTVNASSLIAGFDSGRSAGEALGPRWKMVSVGESTATTLTPSDSDAGLRRARPKIVSVGQEERRAAPCR